jgi:hypothetical protein
MFMPLYDELRESDAFKALKPAPALVLLDLLKVYYRESRFDKEPLQDGIVYTWTHCKVDVSEDAFYRAIKRIVEIGFFERAPHLESGRPGSPRVFEPSKRWQSYRTPSDEKVKAGDSKKRRIQEKRKRRTEYRKQLDTKKRTPSINADKTTSINADTTVRDGGITPSINADTRPKNGNCHPLKNCRSYIKPYPLSQKSGAVDPASLVTNIQETALTLLDPSFLTESSARPPNGKVVSNG